MTRVGLGPRCTVFSLFVFGDMETEGTSGTVEDEHSFTMALHELEAEEGTVRECENM